MNYAELVSGSLRDEMARHGLSDDEAFVTLAEDVEEITEGGETSGGPDSPAADLQPPRGRAARRSST